MKKKLFALILMGVLSVSLIACGGESGDSGSDSGVDSGTSAAESQGEAEPEDDGVINFDGEGYNVTYVKHETGTDYEGNPCLLYYYNFTNNGEENTSAMATTYIQCFQNGVECDTAITTESNDSIDNYLNEVQPEGTIEVCQVYELSDTSDVTIEASDLISFSDAKDTQIIKLQ